jgi:hypothetical protein
MQTGISALHKESTQKVFMAGADAYRPVLLDYGSSETTNSALTRILADQLSDLAMICLTGFLFLQQPFSSMASKPIAGIIRKTLTESESLSMYNSGCLTWF